MPTFRSMPHSTGFLTARWGLAVLVSLALAGRAAAQTPEKKASPPAPAAPGATAQPSAPQESTKAKEAPHAHPHAPQPGAPGTPPPQIKAAPQLPPTNNPQPRPLQAELEPPAPRTSDPQAIAIVENYLKAIGGKETTAKIKDRAVKFRNIKHAATGETVAEIHLFIKDGINFREEWNIEGFDIKGEPLAFSQIYNGEAQEGWVQMLGTVSSLDGRTLQVFVFDKYMDDFFCHWEQDGYTLSLGGQGLVSKDIYGEEIPCDIVVVTDFSGRQTQRHFFSKKDGLLIKKEWQEAGAQQKAVVKKERYYKQYRDIAFLDGSGLSSKVSLRHEILIDGDLDSEQVFTSVRINSGLSPKLFEKPEGKPFDRAITESPKAQPAQPAQPKGIHGMKGKGAITPVTRPPEGSAPKGADAGPKAAPPPPSVAPAPPAPSTPEKPAEKSSP